MKNVEQYGLRENVREFRKGIKMELKQQTRRNGKISYKNVKEKEGNKKKTKS